MAIVQSYHTPWIIITSSYFCIHLDRYLQFEVILGHTTRMLQQFLFDFQNSDDVYVFAVVSGSTLVIDIDQLQLRQPSILTRKDECRKTSEVNASQEVAAGIHPQKQRGLNE